MANKKKKQEKESTIEDFYDLRIDKVDDLVAAIQGDTKSNEKISTNISEITGEPEQKRGSKKSKEFDPYKHDKLSFLPTWVKAIFIKWWFAGAVCFFIMWGIGLSGLESIALVGVIWGALVDILINPIFRMMESNKKEYNVYMMFPFPFKAFWTFFTNVLYYLCITFVVNYCYLGVNELINLMKGTSGLYYVGVEPLLFGVFCVVADMICIGIKDLIVYVAKRGKIKKEEEPSNV
jgi:hypothetical protein